ncbi:3-isopropylmalate dehydratase small subunit [bacterium]|nr:3-isopropylmalate dehydratase small subunit [bacterium]MBU1935781.1 3-isopropylmalate dehydratase small subunit [bacterium]
MSDSTTGHVWKYGDNVNTDVIFPGKYTYTINDPKEMAKHAMEDEDPEFVKKVKAGDVIVAGKNFGCGSSREQAAICLREAGVGAVIAKSFSRIYFRNCINIGLLAVTSSEAVDAIQAGDKVTVDFKNGTITAPAGTFNFPPLPEMILGIVEAGGLIPYTRKRLGKS